MMAAALGGSGAACSTAYQPKTSARIGVVIRHGAAMYVKNGQETPVGPLGGALEPLVAGSPPAAARAHRARTQLSVGVPLYAGGVAALFVGLALSWFPVVWIVVGAASASTGLGFIGAGFTNAIDAVNIHNDSITAPAAAP
jgi:hypothetical protein